MGGTNLHTPQSIFQPVINHQTGQQRQAPWLTMPQIPPMSMPWSIPSLQQPDLVRFTGEGTFHSCAPFLHHKRKLDGPDITDTRPAKQLITEEKMSQHFQGLHISPHTVNAQEPGPSTSTAGNHSCVVGTKSMDLNSLNSSEVNANNWEPKLVVSEELKRLQEEPLLPPSLLSKLERPSMALVLWEPPSKHLRMLTTPREASPPFPDNSTDGNNNGTNPDDDDDNNGNNNNDSIPNLNQTMDVNISDPTLEPMDL
ncbi:hypothetical protein QAD02_014869 [Eretmocerus hayati]|uniref:Uncharacterized protein n=1 Tax=Eretmocerus hayati TaxID=131215 RepID=A0ACC2P6P7_9HYME|nr:hypothetical protein QAD02_014869 [Eretmocerus hayati]